MTDSEKIALLEDRINKLEFQLQLLSCGFHGPYYLARFNIPKEQYNALLRYLAEENINAFEKRLQQDDLSAVEQYVKKIAPSLQECSFQELLTQFAKDNKYQHLKWLFFGGIQYV